MELKGKLLKTKQFHIFRIQWNCKSQVREDGIVMILWSCIVLDIKGGIPYFEEEKSDKRYINAELILIQILANKENNSW